MCDVGGCQSEKCEALESHLDMTELAAFDKNLTTVIKAKALQKTTTDANKRKGNEVSKGTKFNVQEELSTQYGGAGMLSVVALFGQILSSRSCFLFTRSAHETWCRVSESEGDRRWAAASQSINLDFADFFFTVNPHVPSQTTREPTRSQNSQILMSSFKCQLKFYSTG